MRRRPRRPAGPGAPLVRPRRPTPLPAFDGTLATARATADAFARLAKAANTRRANRAGVAAWCAWCARHALPCLPASAADVVAFLAAERQRGLAVSTIDLRRAAIRYLHYLAGCAVPTAEAVVGETLAGIRRDAAQRGDSRRKNSPPRSACCARSSPRSATTCAACATAPCC